MNHLWKTILFLGLLTATAGANEAEKQAGLWLDKLGDKGLVLTLKGKDAGFTSIRSLPNKLFKFSDADHYIGLGFTRKITAQDTAASLQKALQHVALDKLPTPGLAVDGWDISPRTPVSSFKKGVTITGFAKGRIQLTVKTRFFALSGRKRNVLVPADAPMPPGTYFQIRKPFTLDLRIDLPIQID